MQKEAWRGGQRKGSKEEGGRERGWEREKKEREILNGDSLYQVIMALLDIIR